MNKFTRTQRRHLLSCVPLLALLSCNAWPVLAMATTPPDSSRANLLRLVTQPQAALIGAAVLPQLAHQTASELARTLESRLASFSTGNLAQPCELAALHLAFQAAVQADFAQSRCMSVSGWVLAQSEVELCALAYLSATSA